MRKRKEEGVTSEEEGERRQAAEGGRSWSRECAE